METLFGKPVENEKKFEELLLYISVPIGDGRNPSPSGEE